MAHIVENQVEIEQQLIQVKKKLEIAKKTKTNIENCRKNIENLQKIEVNESGWKGSTLNSAIPELNEMEENQTSAIKSILELESTIQNKINELQSKKEELEASLGK